MILKIQNIRFSCCFSSVRKKWCRALKCISCPQTYYVTITAVSSAGNVEVTSDGVTVVTENSPLSDVFVFDGEPCRFKGNDLIFV